MLMSFGLLAHVCKFTCGVLVKVKPHLEFASFQFIDISSNENAITSLRMLHCYFWCPYAGFYIASLLHTEQKSTISNNDLPSV